ncbi:MAG: ImmA/IrrE family metallo-endopeptidase [Pyrinomonadaceae bacterium]
MDESLLPPTQKGRWYELRALGLREFAGLRRDTEPLDPFMLARYAKLLVAEFRDIEASLSPETRAHLLGDGSEAWSGGASSKTLPNGWRLVILNPTHGPSRTHATLMEEVCHVFLGHKANRLAIMARDKQGQVVSRDFNDADEEAAYATGAAALVPYSALKRAIKQGRTSQQIARHFNVSNKLVAYRIKVSRLWAEYKRKQGMGVGG